MPLQPVHQLEVVRFLQREGVWTHVAAVVLAMGMLCFGLFLPKMRKLDEMSKKLQEMKSFITGTEQAVKQLENMDAVLKERQDELKALKKRILKVGGEAAMVETFTEVVEDLPVTILGIEPSEEDAQTGLDEEESAWKRHGLKKIMLKVHMQCRYQTLGSILERLEIADLAFDVEKLGMKTAEQIAPNLDIELVLSVFSEMA